MEKFEKAFNKVMSLFEMDTTSAFGAGGATSDNPYNAKYADGDSRVPKFLGAKIIKRKKRRKTRKKENRKKETSSFPIIQRRPLKVPL